MEAPLHLYQQFVALKQEQADINYTLALMQWDQEVYMPKGGAEMRARQISSLAGYSHELATSSKYEETLLALQESFKDFNTVEQTNIQESLKTLRKNKTLDKDFVVRFNQTVSESYQSWVKAREENSYTHFGPHLGQVIELSKERAQRYGYTHHPYDALMDDYEPEMTTETIKSVLSSLKPFLTDLIRKIRDQPQPDQSLFHKKYPVADQFRLCSDLAKEIGFNFNDGRLDLSPHPFTTSFNAQDVRITTRLNEDLMTESIWGTLHESGHGMYEQGLPANQYGLPAGEATSLGIHESQSRLWENNVGKSLSYIKHIWPQLTAYFPAQLAGSTPDQFFKGLNIIHPDLIRINSDEVTYHLHIMIRFEMELAMLEDQVSINELPALWNQKIKDYLGLDVPGDAQGILQDIHWSHGSIGYFPTYTLGSLYAAQFFAFADKSIQNLDNQILEGNYAPLLQFLRTNIHIYGKQFNSEELCNRICGEGLNPAYFEQYITSKYSQIYQL